MARSRVTGFRMPAEWEPHEGTWISWPKDPDTFPSGILPAVERTYAKLVKALGKGEEVRILVNDSRAESRVRTLVGDANVSFRQIKTVDVWVRDYGPTYVGGRKGAAVKWIFNAWGNKYEDLKPDNDAGEEIAVSSGLTVIRPGIVLEGGSIDVNGAGSLLTTEQCLLNPNRNPGMGRRKLEEVLGATLGVTKIVWLGGGIEGDDTDGHVDDVARFVDGRNVVAAAEPERSDSNHGALKENLRRLEESQDQDGRPLEVVEIPMPRRIVASDGRLPASHLNFYVGNDVVVVPTFGGESDRLAVERLQEAFPKREVIGIDCRALVYGLGTLHCVTQQIPVYA
ncbi:MAG TPA: agmatine deiminase family protein [Nitrososphaerales archaeon]|nr:agmatine deiminase family protein [Nitrososphaerales archaeon]